MQRGSLLLSTCISKQRNENHLDFGKNALLYVVHGFWPKMIPYERASKEEQNSVNFSFVAPSTVE